RAKRLTADPRALPLALIAVVALIAVNAPGIFHHVDIDDAAYGQQGAKMVVLNLGPSVVPDNAVVYFDAYTYLTVGHYRDLVERYGAVAGTHPAHPDPAIVALADVKLHPVSESSGNCVAL